MSTPNSFPIEQLTLEHVNALKSYTPGKQPLESDWTKLNTNENPFPPAPAVASAIAGELNKLPLYPNPTSAALRQDIANLHGLRASQVFVGNGSDEVINLLIRAFSDRTRTTGITDPSYSLYPVLLAIQQASLVRVPFDFSMTLPVEAIIDSGANLFLLTSPNAPTGVGFSNHEISRILDGFHGLLVIDEAYADFAEENAVPLLEKYPHAIVVRTFSKSYSLAGLRVGYALAHPEVVDRLDRIRDSYNVNRLSQAAARAAINDQAYFLEKVIAIKELREEVSGAFSNWDWFTYPSQANFIFARPVNGKDQWGAKIANNLFEFLLSNRILVRYFPSNPLTESFLRISIGGKTENDRLLTIINQWRKTV